MTTDEHTTPENELTGNGGQLDERMAQNASTEENYDELEATGVLDRNVLRQRLGTLDAQSEEAADQEPDEPIAQTEPETNLEDVRMASLPDLAGEVDDASVPEMDSLPDLDTTPVTDNESAQAADPDATVFYDVTQSAPEINRTPQETSIPSLRGSLLSLPSIDEDDIPQIDAEPFDSTETDNLDAAAETDVESSDSQGATDIPSIEVPEERPNTFAKGGRGRRVLKIVGIVSGSLLAIYGIGGLFFTSHFMPNTRVNGDEVSWMSVDDLATHVTEVGQAFQSHIVGDGIDLTIAASDIDLNYDGTAYGLEAGSQIDPWKWPTSIFGSHDFRASTGITFNQDKLNAIVLAAVDGINATAQPPTNATMAFDEPSQSFVPVPDALGTMVDPATTLNTVSDGIRTLQADITLGDTDLTQPIVRYEDEALAAVIARANAICQASIPLRIAGRDAGAIDINLVKSWLYTNENCELLVNVDNVKAWSQGDLSKQFDTAGTERKYTRADGKEVTVTGGDYGWNIDGEALANLVAQNLQVDNVGPIDVPMKSTAVEWNPGGADWGKRYIDVDMSEQYVRVYGDDGQLVIESPCVTGVPYHATDEGVYSIFEHTENMVLVGLDYNGDGKPDYETPVSYWMPFNGGQGLHDAYWRYSFGGDIWQYDGSHGCVNLPSDVAAQLFEWSHVGDVVVVHW